MELSIETIKAATSSRLKLTRKKVLRPILVSTIYLTLLVGLSSVATVQPVNLIEPWHLPVGFALGILLVYGFRYIPLVFAGQAMAAFWPDLGPGAVPLALLVAIMTTGPYVLAAFAINLAVRRSKIDLMNASHLRIFLLMVPVTAIVVSGGTLMNLWFQGLIPDAGLWNLVLMEVTASATGILLVTPAALLLMAKFIHRILERLTEEQKKTVRLVGRLEECHFPFSVQRGHLRLLSFSRFRIVSFCSACCPRH